MERMIDRIPPAERQHYLCCPSCGQFFDLRDLLGVLQHQHLAGSATPRRQQKPKRSRCSARS